MSYKPTNLSVLAYANGFTLWHYVNEIIPLKTGESITLTQE